MTLSIVKNLYLSLKLGDILKKLKDSQGLQISKDTQGFPCSFNILLLSSCLLLY